MEKQTFYSYGCIVDGLVGAGSLYVAYLAAVSVDTVAYSVDEAAFFTVHLNGGKVLDILVYRERNVGVNALYVAKKIISRACGKIEYLIFNIKSLDIINKMIQRSVAACNNYNVILRKIFNKRSVIIYFRHV